MDYYMKSPNSVMYSYSPPISPDTRLLGDAEKKLLELNHQQDLQNIKLGNVTLNLDWAVENTSTFHKGSAVYAKVNLYDTLWNLSSHDYTIKHWIKNYPNCIVEMIKTADKNMKSVVKKGILEEKSCEYLLAVSSMGILSNILSTKKGLKFFLKRVSYMENFFELLIWILFHLDYLHADDLKKEILRFIYFGTLNLKVCNIYRYNDNFYKVLKVCLQPSNISDILESTLLIIQNLLYNKSDSMHCLYVIERLPAKELKFIAVNGDYSLKEMSECILKKAENIYHTHTFDSEEIVMDFSYDTPVHQQRDSLKIPLADKRERGYVDTPVKPSDNKRRRSDSMEVNFSPSDIIPCKKSKIRHKRRREVEESSGDKASSDISPRREKESHAARVHNRHHHKHHKKHKKEISLENRHVSCHLMEMQMQQQREEIISKELLLKDVSNILDSIMTINNELIAEITSMKNEIKDTLTVENKMHEDVINKIDYLENETSPSFISDKDLPSPDVSKDTQSGCEENVGILDSNYSSGSSKKTLVENTRNSMLKLIEINKKLMNKVSSLRDRFRTSYTGSSSAEDSKVSFLKESLEQSDISKSCLRTITFNKKFLANSSHSIQTEDAKTLETVATSPFNSIRVFTPLKDSLTSVPVQVHTKTSIGRKICDVINKTASKIVDITNTDLPDDFIDKLYEEFRSDIDDKNFLSPAQISEILDITRGDVDKKLPKNTLKSGIKKKKNTVWSKYLKYLKSKVLNILYINISYAMQKSSCLIHPYVLTRKDTLPTMKNLKTCKKQSSLTRRCYLKKNTSGRPTVSSSSCFMNTRSSGTFYVSGNFCDVSKRISSLSFSKSSSQSGQFIKSISAPTFEFCTSLKDKEIKVDSPKTSKLPVLKKETSGKKPTVTGGTEKPVKKTCNKKRTHKVVISTSVAQTDIKISPK